MTLRCPLKITILAFAAALLAVPASAMQCAIYARQVTGFQLFGSAYSWWNQAAGKYDRGHRPVAGSILVFENSSRLYHGHVAVVRAVINNREILVDHSNWNVGRAKRGSVSRGVRVRDRSPGNDWSMVNVWLTGSSEYGTGDYPTAGFIYNAPAGSDEDEKYLPPSMRASSKRNKNGTISAKQRPGHGRAEVRAVEQRQVDRRTPEHVLTARADAKPADKGVEKAARKPVRGRDTLVAEAKPVVTRPETARRGAKPDARAETVIAAAPVAKSKPAHTELLAQAKPAKGKAAGNVQVAQAKPPKRSAGQNASLLAQTGPTP